jgi:hypothetical protein
LTRTHPEEAPVWVIHLAQLQNGIAFPLLLWANRRSRIGGVQNQDIGTGRPPVLEPNEGPNLVASGDCCRSTQAHQRSLLYGDSQVNARKAARHVA